MKEGDVITFRSEELFVTYRITEVVRGEDGSVHSFRAIGDQDAKEGVNVPLTVSPENVIGRGLAGSPCSCRRPWAF